MHDEGEVDADGEIRYGGQVRPRQFKELEDLDEGQKLFLYPAIKYHLGQRQPSHEVHKSAVGVKNSNGTERNGTTKGEVEINATAIGGYCTGYRCATRYSTVFGNSMK